MDRKTQKEGFCPHINKRSTKQAREKFIALVDKDRHTDEYIPPDTIQHFERETRMLTIASGVEGVY